jgi:HSP20 family protein
MLMRFDPFREFDRFAEMASAAARAPRSMAMDAIRRGDRLLVRFDLPGADPDSIDLMVERNALTVRAERRSDRQEGDEVIVMERPEGTFQRQIMLSDRFDTENVQASYTHGVLEVTVPVAAQAQPRRIPVGAAEQPEQIQAEQPQAAGMPGQQQAGSQPPSGASEGGPSS